MPRFLSPNFPIRPNVFPFYYGWIAMALSICGMLASAPGQTIGFSVFTDSLMAVSGLDRVQLSTAYFIGTFVSSLFLKFVGRFYDAKGGRLLFLISGFGLAGMLLVFSSFGFFFSILKSLDASNFLAVSLFIMSIGFLWVRFLGQGMLSLTSRNLIGKWFQKDRGFVSAVSGLSVSIGFSLMPAIFLYLINQHGWERSYQLISISLILFVFIGWVFYRDNPEECGISIDSYGRIKRSHEQEKAKKEIQFNLKQAQQTLALWVVCLALALHALVITAVSFHIVDIGKLAMLSKAEVVAIFIPIAIFSGLFDLIAGFLADRIPLKYVIALMMFGSCLGFSGIIFLSQNLGYWCAVVGIGISNGCFSTLSIVSMPHYFGRQYLGENSGYQLSCMVLGTSIGPISFALSKYFFQSYNPALLGSVFIAFSILILSSKIEKPQEKS